MEKNYADGKVICLQRLRGNQVTKSLRFLESDVTYKVFDFYSKKYNFYRSGNNLVFKQIRKEDFVKQIQEKDKPEWISKTEFNKILSSKNELEKFELIDDAILKYDQKTNTYYNNLIRFSNKQNDYKKDKGQNILFNIEYLVSGKLESGDEIRFPFVLREIDKININKQKKEVSFTKTNKFIPNIPFLTWLGNKQNKQIESKLEKIKYLDEHNFIKDQISIYSYLGIDVKEEDFSKLLFAKELTLNKENKSLANAIDTARHEAQHAIILLHYGLPVESISINSFEDYEGLTMSIMNDDDYDVKTQLELLDVFVAPYLKNKEFILNDDFSLNNLKSHDLTQSDFHNDYKMILFILDNIEELFSNQDKETLLINSIKRTNDILLKYDQKINMFVDFLMKHKFMNSDEILEQFQSDELIESYNKKTETIKLERNTFKIEKVELIGLFENIISEEIYNDTKKIFSTNYVDELLENNKSNQTEKPIFMEDKINWSFDADISQQKAVFETLNSNRLVIQGPPGTGKTQTILNIISENLSKSKKVLVVSEKITAVEVIFDRFARDGSLLSPLIFDLYNVEKSGINFYNEIGEKFLQIINFQGNSEVSDFKNMNSKVIELNELSINLNNLDLSNNFDIFIQKLPNQNELIIFNQIINDIDKIKPITKDKYLEFILWKKQEKEIEQKEVDLLPPNISRDMLIELLDLNKKQLYSSVNWINFVSFLTTGKFKISFFKKKKIQKMILEKNILDKIFLNKKNFEIINNMLNFDKQKYNNEEKRVFQQYEFLKDSNYSLERMLEIKSFNNYFDSFKSFTSKLKSLEPTNYTSIDENDRFNFKATQNTIMTKHSQFVRSFMSNNNLANKEFEKLKSRKVLNIKMKNFIKEYWNIIFEIFPVILATPELVSKYIPYSKDLYDVVIIDEASQFLLERAIPSLYRGREIIISGDKHQLRPLVTGQRFDSNSQLDEFHDVKYKELIENESILDLFDYLYPDNQVMLKTHYRSQRTELIDFSNKNFYENQLIFIEHADNNSQEIPIETLDVNGNWIDQTNEEEAREIINLLMSYLSKNIFSIGVILFTKKQANFIKKIIYKDQKYQLIVDALESFESDGLFIKSIEQVQGEERDIIIFGITYGNMVKNYGFLSKKYGENRINVAITRSKEKMIIVKSHGHNEYRRNIISKSNGPKLFFKFLEYVDKLNSLEVDNKETIIMNTKTKKLKNYLDKKGINIKKIINIGDSTFFISDSNEAFYLIDEKSLKSPREQIWFFDNILKSKKYEPKATYITDIYLEKLNEFSTKININQ